MNKKVNAFWVALFFLTILTAFGAHAESLSENTVDFLSMPMIPKGDAIQTGALADVIDLDAAVFIGADYLRNMQADITEDNAGNGTDGFDESPDDPDDGGWDWAITSPPAPFSHSVNPSPTNIYGATALGLYHAYIQTDDSGFLTAMQDAADAILAGGTGNMRTASDLIFLLHFNDLPEIPGTDYQDIAKAKYDARISAYGGAQAWAQYIRDVRNGQGYSNGIIAWDIGAWVIAAAMLEDYFPGNNYSIDAVYMAEVLYQDSFNDNPGYFDIIDDQGWDPGYGNVNYWWYTLGISGLLDAFTAADVHASEIPGLLAILENCRFQSGAYSFSYGANEYDEDWQSTAYTVASLAQYNLSSYQDAINISAFWIATTQDVSGGFLYESGEHYPEIAGECIRAMSFGENPMEVWVDDDFCDICANDGHAWGYDAFDNIQDGVSVAGVDMVHVGPGIYQEQISISSNLTLEGAGKDISVIQSPTVLTEYFTYSANNFPIVYIHDASDVVMHGFTVDGLGRGNSNYRFVGVGFWNSGGSLTDVRLTGVRDTPFSGAQHGVSVYAYNNTGGPYEIDLVDVDIDDMQKTAIVLGAAGLTASVTECTIAGQGPTSITAQNGIQISDGAVGSIENTEIYDIDYIGSGWSASGLLLYYPGPGCLLNGNTVYNCQGALNAYFCDDLVISGNTFDQNDFQFIWGGDGADVGENQFTNCPEALYVADAVNINIHDNDFDLNGLAVILDGLVDTAVLFENELLNSSTAAVIVQPYVTDEPVGVTIHCNHISGNAFGVSNTTTIKVNAERNWWGDYTGPAYGVSPLNILETDRPLPPRIDSNFEIPKGQAKVSGDRKFQGKSRGGLITEGSGDPVTELVDYSPWWGGNYCHDSHSSPWTWCIDNSNNSTVQEGVDEATAGDLLMVMPGVFEEQIVITKENLTIVGAGSDSDPEANSIILAPIDMPYYFATSANNYPVIGLDGINGVSLQNLRIDGAGRGNSNYRFAGIGFWNAGGSISQCQVVNIQDTPFSGAQHGIGVYSYNNTGGPYTISIHNSVLEGFQKNGIALGGDGLTIDIADCSVTGAGPTTITAQNGIQAGFGAGGTIEDCVVSDIGYLGENWGASGFLFYNGTSINLTGVTVSNSQSCVVYQETQGAIVNVDITPGAIANSEGISIRDYGSLFNDNSGEIKVMRSSPLIEDWKPIEEVPLIEPTVVSIDGSALHGVNYAGSYGIAGWSLGDDIFVTVNGTSVTGWEIGVVAYEDGSSAVVTANGNIIAGNTGGYWSNSVVVQDARANWWGDFTGPFHPTSNPEAIGNEIGDLIDYSPWWSAEYLGDDHTDPWHWLIDISNGSTIQEGIDYAAAGDSITATEDVYTGSSLINKPLTLIGDPGARVEVGDHNLAGLNIESSDVTVNTMRFCECKIGISIYLDQAEYSISHGYSNIRLLNNTVWNTYGDRGFGIYIGTESERYNPADPLGIYDPSLTSLLDFTGLQIIGNRIFHTQQAALVLQSITATTGVLEVTDNEFFEIPSFSGVWIDAAQKVTLDGNEFRDCGYGAFLSSYADGYYEGSPNDTYDPKNIVFSNNTVTLNDHGFAVYDGWPSSLTFYHNSITDNTEIGFYNYLPFELDATLNYWGSLDGPSHSSNPVGDGDIVSDFVDYDPWCNEDFTICNFHVGANCDYVIGDYNGNGTMNVADVIAAFSKLQTGEPDPAYACECPAGSGNEWAVAMDVNNSCTFNVADVIAAFSKLQTGMPDLFPCEACPPGERILPGDDNKPAVIPGQHTPNIGLN